MASGLRTQVDLADRLQSFRAIVDRRKDTGLRVVGSLTQSGHSAFGVDISEKLFVVLDKSFLQGVNAAQLLYYAQSGWVFGIPDVLWYEHFRKRDDTRIANVFKLRKIESSLRILPGIGEMFRAETKYLEPAARNLRAKFVKISEILDLDSAFNSALRTAKAEVPKWEWKLDQMIAIWRDFEKLEALKEAKQTEIKERVQELKIQIRDDLDDIRGFYKNHRPRDYPQPELLDEDWTLYSWIQANLLGGLDYFASYGATIDPNREKLLHELFDIEYLICAVLVGGLACREKRIIERFKLLRPNGVLLR